MTGGSFTLHDVVGWWDGHPQPASVEEILAQARLEDAFTLISLCRQSVGTDPRASALRLGARVIDTALWEWRFASDARYLVCATVTERGKARPRPWRRRARGPRPRRLG
jgi:hypothetical protein